MEKDGIPGGSSGLVVTSNGDCFVHAVAGEEADAAEGVREPNASKREPGGGLKVTGAEDPGMVRSTVGFSEAGTLDGTKVDDEGICELMVDDFVALLGVDESRGADDVKRESREAGPSTVSVLEG